MMNIENLAIDILETPDTQPAANVESTPEIKLLPLDSFRFIGGGNASVQD
jgi:hypothetical protein